MKRFTFFSLMSLTFSLAVMSQNQVVDDVYFNPKDPESVHPATQSSNVNSSSQKPNYKNGALEIVFKERKNTARTATSSSVVRDTVYVVGQTGTNKSSKPTTLNAAAGSMIVHDTIYVSEILLDSLDNNTEKGYYLNGFNGTETDKEYAERIRRFHNPKYTVFIGDPRYNDIFFLNNIDWNVYLDGSFAYVTPTWTNPYWWNYSFSPFGGYGGFGNFGGYGLGRSFYSPFYGYNNFYDSWGYSGFYGGLYGYGNYWDPYSGYGGYGYGGFYNGYGGYGGLYNGYGSYYGYSNYNRNKNYDEQTRRATNNYGNRDSRLGGTRTDAASSAVTSGGGGAYSTTPGTTPSRNKYTVLSGTRSDNSANNSSGVATRGTMNSVDRTTSTQTNGIGVVRSTFSSGRTEGSNAQSNRSSSTNINTLPRTFTTTISSVPTGSSSNTSREANPSVQSSGSMTIRSTTSGATRTTVVPSRESYVSGGSRGSSQTYTPSTTYSTSGRSSSASSTPSYTPSYSTSSSSSSSSSSNSSSGGGGGDRSSSSGGGRR